ncbi:MAG: hypothetical protein K6E18_03465 [Lachnospiraceae bacterium]|nr:hypothetical protein [Lachnospiraceae bacterium]
MSALLEIRDVLRDFYSKHELYLFPFLKFCLAFVVILTINFNLGVTSRISNMVVVLMVALLSACLPLNLLVVFAMVFTVIHFYEISLECAIAGGAVFLLMFLLYYRFSPRNALVVLFMPIFFGLKIPFVVPIVVGLLCSVTGAVAVGCGVIAYYVIAYMKDNATLISSLDADNLIARFRYIVDGLLEKKGVLVVLLAFCSATIIVWLLRRLSVDYAWTIAIFAGSVIMAVILLLGGLNYDTGLSTGAMIGGLLGSLLLAFVVQFFAFNVDYSRTELVQYEDDEYYYYVKAIPKNSVSKSKRAVKKITSVL